MNGSEHGSPLQGDTYACIEETLDDDDEEVSDCRGGLDTDIKRLIRPFTTAEFDSPSNFSFFADARRVPKLKTAHQAKPFISHFTAEIFTSPLNL
eukprot:5530748-Pyramimonas_sp.AAC.2